MSSSIVEPEGTMHQAETSFPVVGIGASNKGMQAFQQFFDALPETPGMAFVIAMHLAPDKKNQVAKVLQNQTTLAVEPVVSSVTIAPNHAYIVPPEQHLQIKHGQLSPVELNSGKQRPSVDRFFRSLAADQGENTAVLVLPGNGVEGTLGLKTIGEYGGLTLMLSTPKTSPEKRPQNALSTDLIDVVGPASKLVKTLTHYGKSISSTQLPSEKEPLSKKDHRALKTVFKCLRKQTRNDFSNYKRSSVLRRIRRRMGVTHTASLPEYVQHLRQNPGETNALFRDLLIGVTSFFRDPVTFQVLAQTVIPELFANKTHQEQIRVWVPGCATGEEAYSLAMLLAEYREQQELTPTFQIFATDIDEQALDTARAGFYPPSAAANVSEKRLERFFTREEKGYRIGKSLRDRIVFAEHNLLRDPPFAQLDLISCRNLLIYLDSEIQKEIFNVFHYALTPGGYLQLGSSESADPASNLFEITDKKHRLVKRRSVTVQPNRLPPMPLQTQKQRPNPSVETTVHSVDPSLEELHRKLLLKRHSPPSVIVDKNHEILHLMGSVDRFLHHANGLPTYNLLQKVSPDLRLELRGPLFQAARKGEKTVKQLRIEVQGSLQPVRISVEPIQEAKGFILVTFEELEIGEEYLPTDGKPGQTIDPRVEELEEELTRTKRQLQTTIEEYETTNEELQSSNEELQSSNEELETSQEELRSMNEELSTINEKLEQNVAELRQANSDLRNLMAASEVSILFLDRDLRITRYTPSTTDLFNLIPSDIGRPFSEVTHKFVKGDLITDAQNVRDELSQIQREAQDKEGNWYIMRMRPYESVDNRIEGVVLTFLDITERKHAEQALQKVNDELEARVQKRTAKLRASESLKEAMLQAVPDTIFRLSKDGTFLSVHTDSKDMPIAPVDKHLGKSLDEVYPEQLVQKFQQATKRVAAGSPQEQFFYSSQEQDNKKLSFEVRITALANQDVLATVRDVTWQQRLQREILEISSYQQRRIGQDLHDGLASHLSGTAMMIQGLTSELRQGGTVTPEQIEEVGNLIREGVEQTRGLARGLNPIKLGKDGLVAALQDLIANMKLISDVDYSFETAGNVSVELPGEITTHLYRIVQEAVNNASTHANAQQVKVCYAAGKEGYMLEVCDDGVGISRETIRQADGMGLRTMQYRANIIGADFSVEPASKGGTKVSCSLSQENLTYPNSPKQKKPSSMNPN